MTTILQRIKLEEHCKVPLRDGCRDAHVERVICSGLANPSAKSR
ncbi:hypothetical protein [Nitrosomonas sp.]